MPADWVGPGCRGRPARSGPGCRAGARGRLYVMWLTYRAARTSPRGPGPARPPRSAPGGPEAALPARPWPGGAEGALGPLLVPSPRAGSSTARRTGPTRGRPRPGGGRPPARTPLDQARTHPNPSIPHRPGTEGRLVHGSEAALGRPLTAPARPRRSRGPPRSVRPCSEPLTAPGPLLVRLGPGRSGVGPEQVTTGQYRCTPADLTHTGTHHLSPVIPGHLRGVDRPRTDRWTDLDRPGPTPVGPENRPLTWGGPTGPTGPTENRSLTYVRGVPAGRSGPAPPCSPRAASVPSVHPGRDPRGPPRSRPIGPVHNGR